MKRRVLVSGAVAIGLLVGAGAALAVGSQGTEPPVLTPADCESRSMSTGDVTHASGDAVDRASPLEQAQRFVEGAGILEHFPEARVVSKFADERVAVVALADGDLQVGELRYSRHDSGWRVDSISICSPGSKQGSEQ